MGLRGRVMAPLAQVVVPGLQCPLTRRIPAHISVNCHRNGEKDLPQLKLFEL
jgi:hypothetical protein